MSRPATLVLVLVSHMTVARAQGPELYFIPAGADPSAFTGRLSLTPNQGDLLCFDLAVRAPTPAHKAWSAELIDATGGTAGSAKIVCNTVAVDLGDPNIVGVTAGSLTPTIALQDCDGGSAPPNNVRIALIAIGQELSVSSTGNYVGELCYQLSADACGSFAIDYSRPCDPGATTGCASTLTISGGNGADNNTYNGVDIFIGQTNDECTNAATANDGLNAYDTLCAQSDALAGSCSALDTDIWFSYTATCTGELTVSSDNTDVAVYNAGVGCNPTLGDEAGCANAGGNVVLPLVAQGNVLLIQVGTNDGSETTGTLDISCAPACTQGQPAGSTTTNLECGDGIDPNHRPSQCEIWSCDPTFGCLPILDPNPTPCEDGEFCTTGETCNNGVCGGGGPRNCSAAGNQCNVGVCNETTDQCEPDPAPREGQPCNDFQFCTIGETCTAGVCNGGSPRDCSAAGDQCNIGVCNESTNQCVPSPANENAPCDDGEFCTTGETCMSGACTGGAPTDCSAVADQCNTAVCNDTTNQCEPDPAPHEGNPCDDGLVCNIGETCTNGNCDGGSSVDCSDMLVCTFDECLEDGEPGVIGQTVPGGGCSIVDVNLLPCATIANCPSGADDCLDGFCVCAKPPCIEQEDCDDMDACTWDQCLPEGCIYTPNIFGDVDHSGLVDLFDILCMLDGFAGIFNDCTPHDLDIFPCDGSGHINLFDILSVLDAFAGGNNCSCPAGP